MMGAVIGGDPGIVRILLEKGAKVEARGWQRRTALMLAAEHCDPDIVRLLLAHGSDVNARDADGQTPLKFASRPDRSDTFRPGKAETIKLLKQAGAKE